MQPMEIDGRGVPVSIVFDVM